MASSSLESTGSSSPAAPSFRFRDNNCLFRSISSREPSFSTLRCSSPARISSATPPSLPSSPTFNHRSKTHINKLPSSSYRCISSILKKDGQILSIAVSNGLIYTGSESGCIRIWKLPEFTEYGQLKTRAGMACALAVSNDQIFAAYADCKIRIWSKTSDTTPTCIRFQTIPKIGSLLWNYIAGKEKRTMKHSGPVSSLAINLSEDLLYSASLDKTVKIWRISDLKCIETIQAHSHPINAIVVGDDGVIYTASDDTTVRVWRRNFCSGDHSHSLTLTLQASCSPVKALVLNTDGGGSTGGVLYGGCSDGYVHYWLKGWFPGQLDYGGALQGHTHAVMCLYTLDSYVISGSADCTCRVWFRQQEGQHSCLAVLPGHRAPIRCVTACIDQVSGERDDGCTVLTGSLDGVLKVWRITLSRNSGRSSMPSWS